jgi:hypothetical protein
MLLRRFSNLLAEISKVSVPASLQDVPRALVVRTPVPIPPEPKNLTTALTKYGISTSIGRRMLEMGMIKVDGLRVYGATRVTPANIIEIARPADTKST